MNAERYVALMVTSWSQNSNSHANPPYWTKVQYTPSAGSVYFPSVSNAGETQTEVWPGEID
jgi:hypothetical protein